MPALTERGLTGFGLGLRAEHYADFLDGGPQSVDFLEIVSENFIGTGGRPMRILERIRADYPMTMHGVSLSIGGSDPLDEAYLDGLAALADRIRPALISDHLCWTGTGGINLHDLLPLPLNDAVLGHVAGRVDHVQERLGRNIALENVSAYIRPLDCSMSEWDFLAALSRRCGCRILLDLNNLLVTAHNQGFDPRTALDGIPVGSVAQIHLAGNGRNGKHLIDSHDRPVADGVWNLLASAIARFGSVPVSIERDAAIPPLAELLAELDRARDVAALLERAA